MNLHQLYLTENDCYKANRWITPKGVMVHSTGSNRYNEDRKGAVTTVSPILTA